MADFRVLVQINMTFHRQQCYVAYLRRTLHTGTELEADCNPLPRGGRSMVERGAVSQKIH